LERAAEKLNELLIKVSKRADEDLEEFLSQPGLGPSIGILADLFSQLRTDSWENLEKIVKTYFKHEPVQDSFENFLEAEKTWNNFIIRFDQEQKNGSKCNNPGATLLLGDILNFQIGLENARSGENQEIGRLLDAGQDFDFVHCILLRHFA